MKRCLSASATTRAVGIPPQPLRAFCVGVNGAASYTRSFARSKADSDSCASRRARSATLDKPRARLSSGRMKTHRVTVSQVSEIIVGKRTRFVSPSPPDARGTCDR